MEMWSGRTQTLVVSRSDGVSLFQPRIQIIRVSLRPWHPRRRAYIRSSGIAMGPRDDWPSSGGRLTLRKIDCAGNRDGLLTIDAIRRGIQNAQTLRRIREHQALRQRFL